MPAAEKVASNEVDLEQIEGLAGKAATDALRRLSIRLLDRRRHDDLHEYLVELGIKMALEFDPTVGPAFSTYFYRRARQRVVDWLRKTHGDPRYAAPLSRLEVTYPAVSLSRIDDDTKRADALAVGPEPSSFADALVELGRDLSPEARWALVNLAGRMVDDGLTENRAFAAAGVTRAVGRRLLKELRSELRKEAREGR